MISWYNIVMEFLMVYNFKDIYKNITVGFIIIFTKMVW